MAQKAKSVDAAKLQAKIIAKTTESLQNKEEKVTAVKKEDQVTKKVKKAVKKQVENNLIESVVTKREVKYLYPEGCEDTLSRKKHRQAIRNKLHKLELEMLRIEDKTSKEFKAKEKEYTKFKAENIKVGVAV